MLRVRRVRTGTRFSRWTPLLSAALFAMSPPAGAQTADGKRALGKLEQQTVDETLAGLGARIDPAPEGKTVGRIYVINQNVFSKHDWYFQLLNIFHWTTRGYILEREVLLRPGQRYDQGLVEETIRNIQNPPGIVIGGKAYGSPELSSVVVLVPIASSVPGQVDLLLVTRDIWSLRFNTNYEYQGNALTLFESSLSENNLFGWRKYLSFGFSFDQGKYYYGPTYFDPNIHGTRLTLYAAARFNSHVFLSTSNNIATDRDSFLNYMTDLYRRMLNEHLDGLGHERGINVGKSELEEVYAAVRAEQEAADAAKNA